MTANLHTPTGWGNSASNPGEFRRAPSTYNGDQFLGGGNQADVAAQWSLAAKDIERLADELREMGPETNGAADALDSYAAGVAAIGECIASDNPNFGGTRILGATLCNDLDAQVAQRGGTAGTAMRGLIESAGR